jgi:anionic cell wall polymer biosynthesis LytR-Cps2A-Psr (LCP) family protein
MAKKHNWLLIVLGIVVFVVVVGIAMVAGFGYYMYRQIEPSRVTAGNPEQQFEELRARFKGETPFIDIATADEAQRAVHREQERTNPAPISKLRLATYDPQEKALVRVSIPMWLLRWAKDKPIKFSATSGAGIRWEEDAPLKVTPAEIERHGPGLLVDTVSRRGERILLWAE